MTTKYIAIDGYDCSGKSTVIHALTEYYAGKKILVERLLPLSVGIFLEYGNGHDYYKNIPYEFRVVSYLWETYIRLNLLAEKYSQYDYVFFDRWLFTSYVNEKKLDFGPYKDLIAFIKAKVTKPDYLFLIQSDPETILKRLKRKNDWMLHYKNENEIISESTQFYKGYVEQLTTYNVPYRIVQNNTSIETCIDNIIDTLHEEFD